LAAIIDQINRARSLHVVTIEDPVEFVHANRRSIVSQRELGQDTETFDGALRAAIRQDADVILVGELRDLETIGLALTAAETGHLVLGTLHTTSAAKTIDRLIDVFPSADKAMVRTMLSGSLRAVIAQTLLRRPDGAGRVAAFEVLVGTPAVANLIRENQISQINAMMQTGARYGMQLMTDAIQALVAMGLVDAAEAARGASAWTGEGQSGRSSLAVDLASAAGVGPAQPGGPRLATPRAAEPEYAF
jgi:twitching motility protein PilT